MANPHQLAAIMFTDIVGYTSLMGDDESNALELVRRNRQIHQLCLRHFGGKLLKEMGDGMLARFDSVSDAVYCAGAILSAVKPINGLKLRIGIHLGDVIVENGEIYGDGVNVASRIQSTSSVNQLVVSESAAQNVKNKDGISTMYLGEFELKNVEYPLKLFAVGFDPKLDFEAMGFKKANRKAAIYIAILILLGIPLSYFLVTQFKSGSQISNATPGIRSVAVLPFANLTGDSLQTSMLAGFQDNLITTLSQIRSVDVISRTSTLKYSNPEGRSLPEIARELGVDAIIEASVYQSDDSIRVNFQLIQAFPEEHHLWAQTYDRSFRNVLYLFDEVTQAVASEINATLNGNVSTFSSPRQVNTEAYKAYLTGDFYASIPTPENLESALNYFNHSISLDSVFAPPYAGISYVWIAKMQLRIVTPAEAIPKIYQYNQKAIELDPNFPQAHYIRALMYEEAWDWKNCEQAFERALELDPNHALAHAFYGHYLMFKQRFDEAISHMEVSLKLDPNNPFIKALYGIVLWHNGDLEKAMALQPGVDFIEDTFLYQQGDYKHSIALLHKNYRLDTVSLFSFEKTFAEHGYAEAVAELAEYLESHTRASAVGIALLYNRANRTDDVIRVLTKGYEDHDPDMPYAFVPIELKNLEVDPRYAALAKKMDLPM